LKKRKQQPRNELFSHRTKFGDAALAAWSADTWSADFQVGSTVLRRSRLAFSPPPPPLPSSLLFFKRGGYRRISPKPT
jgi:hypothetical protein